MPQAIHDVFVVLRDELVAIHDRYALYRQLFGHSQKRADLLNRVADRLFGVIQLQMLLDTTLSLCRLTDPAESTPSKPGHRPNLTVQRLVNAVEADDSAFGQVVRSRLDAIEALRDSALERIRSKRIAHNDLSLIQVRYGGGPGLDWPSREQIGNVLRLIAELMNAVEVHYTGVPFAYALPSDDGTYAPLERSLGRDGHQLMGVLEEFATYHDAQVQANVRRPRLRPKVNRP
jgi:hypothetical protein